MHSPSHMPLKRGFQTLVHALFPPECLSCREALAGDEGLCGKCWRETPFVTGEVCERCGAPLQGDVRAGDCCDDCLRIARPWSRGRTALLYKDKGRALVLALKHGDRHDIARPAGRWLANVARDLVTERSLIAPVPLHWTRIAKRRFNQSALLAHAAARELDLPLASDLLKRARATQSLDGKSREERFAEVSRSFVVNPKRKAQIVGRPVLLVDDVMTSGATLASCAETLLASHASEVCVVTLARVAKDT